jgi:hypothetical protein
MFSSWAVTAVVGTGTFNESLVVVVPPAHFAHPFRQDAKTATLSARHQPKFILREREERMYGNILQPARRIVQFTVTFVAISIEFRMWINV